MDGAMTDNYPALSALLDPNNTDLPDLRAVETEALKGRYGQDLVVELGQYADAAKAAGTYRSYNTSLRTLKRIAKIIGEKAFPTTPTFLAKYVAYLGDHDYAHSTIITHLAAIQAVARALDRGIDCGRDYVVKRVLQGVARINGKDAEHPKRAWLPDHTRAALPYFEDLALLNPVKAARNLSVLTMGNGSAMRCHSFTDLNLCDVEFFPQGMLLTLYRTKTRQDAGDVHKIEITRIRDERICPVVTLLRYIDVGRLESGPVYRRVYSSGRVGTDALGGSSIRKIVAETASKIGLDAREFGAHSLRAGMITAGTEAGVATEALMAVSDHRKVQTLLKYVRPERMFARDTTGRVFE
jgi:integrase